jgi:VanZ family protein
MSSTSDGEPSRSPPEREPWPSLPPAAVWFRRLSAIALVGYWLVMFTGTHWPNLSLAAYPENTDKVLHLSGYSGLGFLLALWFSLRGVDAAAKPFGRPFPTLKYCLLILAVIVGYSIFDEVSQPPFGRTCDFWDAVADWIGGSIGVGAFTVLRLAVWRIVGL